MAQFQKENENNDILTETKKPDENKSDENKPDENKPDKVGTEKKEPAVDPAEKLRQDMKNYRFRFREEIFDEEDEEEVIPAEGPVPTREEQEQEARTTKNELILGIVFLEILLQIFGNGLLLILRYHSINYAIGALLGGCVAVLLVNLMLHSVFVATDYEVNQAKKYMKRTYFFRVGIMLAVIGGSLWLLSLQGFFGVLLGILTLKFSAMLWPLLHHYNVYQRFFTKKVLTKDKGTEQKGV